MSFEVLFGVFGLIPSNTMSLHKSRIRENNWRISHPLGPSLFNEAKSKEANQTPSGGSPVSFTGSAEKRPIFSTSGTLANSACDGTLSSVSSSSSSSIASTASTSTITSTTNFIKGGPNYGSILESNSKMYDLNESNINGSAIDILKSDDTKMNEMEPIVSNPSRARLYYCRFICLVLWINALRMLSGLMLEDSILTLDFNQMGAFKASFLIPGSCLAVQAAAVSLIFIRNSDETNWLVPFYSSKDYLIRSRTDFRPKIENHSRRVRISIVLALLISTCSVISYSMYIYECIKNSDAMRNMEDPKLHVERMILVGYLILNVFTAFYSTFICFSVSFYFNLVCSIMRRRFHEISKIIEDLAESNTSKTTNQARKITTLYLEHNEACELLDESNDFWQYLIFFTYFTYIPAYCYCLYNLFFIDFNSWDSFVTWTMHTHSCLIILLVSFSAAGVSSEAHAPYTSLHTLSLIQLPLDVEVNIATFLHRVRGLTIGYSCYDLFAITNASMSNTAAACASYFLIVADFSRSSVFTLTQNGTVQPLSEGVATSTSIVGQQANSLATVMPY